MTGVVCGWDYTDGACVWVGPVDGMVDVLGVECVHSVNHCKSV